jgi:DNA-binding transcriptional LysR family regulator
MAMNSSSCSLMRSRLKMRQIALLAHLDEERSVIRAAEAVGMTQPAASKLLREIEEALQVQLFERHARGIVPTSSGEILVRHARSILSEINLAQQEIATLKSGLSGQASLGTVTTPAANLVPAAIALLKQQHPGLLVNVELDHSRPLLEKLQQGQLDVLVARVLDAGGAENFQFEPLCDEQHAVLVGAQQPLADKPNVKLQDLLHYPWILPPPGSVLRERLVGLFLQQGIPLPANIIQTQSLQVITHLLRTTDAVAVLQLEAVRPLCESGFLSVLIRDLGLEIGCFGIITRRGHKLSPGGRALLDCLHAAAATLYDRKTDTAALPVLQSPPRRRASRVGPQGTMNGAHARDSVRSKTQTAL